MAQWGTGNATNTSFIVYGNGFSSTANRSLLLELKDENETTTIKDIFRGSLSFWDTPQPNGMGGQITVGGLTPGTTYKVVVTIDGNYMETLTETTTGGIEPPKPDNPKFALDNITINSIRAVCHGYYGNTNRTFKVQYRVYGTSNYITAYNGTVGDWNDNKGGYYTISGLQMGTKYEVRFLLSGNEVEVLTATTLNNLPPDVDLLTFTFSDIDIFQIGISVTGFEKTGFQSIKILCNEDGSSNNRQIFNDTVDRWVNFYDSHKLVKELTPNTRYRFRFYFDGSNRVEKTLYATTLPLNIKCGVELGDALGQYQGSTIRLYAHGFPHPSKNPTIFQIFYKKQNSPDRRKVIYEDRVDAWHRDYGSSYYQFNKLEPLTTYEINFYYDNILLDTFIITTKDGKNRPPYFYWKSNQSDIVGGVDKIADIMKASKWKELQDNINAVRKYKGLSDFNFITVSIGDSISAKVYNQIIYALNGLSSSHGATIVSPGDSISAYSMNSLQWGINSIK